MNTVALVVYLICLVSIITGLFIDLILLRTTSNTLSGISEKWPAVAGLIIFVHIMMPVSLIGHLFMAEF